MKTKFTLLTFFIAILSNNLFAQEQAIQTLTNNWHHDAALANANSYFGAMTKDAIFLGTDASERWTRDEFREWSKKYFESKKTWDFKTKERHVYFSSDKKTAWWDEKLDTWMGVCAGAGVAVLTLEGWKITHYQLAMMIPNDKVKSVLELLQTNSKPEHKE